MTDINDNSVIEVTERVKLRRRGKRGIWTGEFRHAGEHGRRSLKTRDLKIAISRAVKLDEELQTGELNNTRLTYEITKAIDEFIEFKKKVDNLKPKSIVKYETELRTFAKFAADKGVKTLQRIRIRLHDEYRAKQGEELDAYTAYNLAIILKGFFKWCVGRKLVAVNPLADVKLVEPVRTVKVAATLAQVNALIAAATPAMSVMIAVLAFTGMRSGELQALRPEDVDLEGNWIHIRSRRQGGWSPKTGASRKVPIHPRIRADLQRLVVKNRKRPWLFCAEPSRRYPEGDHHINTKHLLERFQAMAKKLGMKISHADDGLVVHSLRHFFETFCINSGIPQRVVDIWMGHVGGKSVSALYYQLTEDESQAFMLKVPFDRITDSSITQGGNSHGVA